MKLSEYDISYLPRPAMKAQVLADFLVECTTDEHLPEERPRPPPGEAERLSNLAGARPPAEARHPFNSAKEESEMISINTWTLHVDGASNEQGSGAGLVLKSPRGVVAEYTLRFSFKTSNNQAEYEALIAGLRIAKDLKVDKLRAYSDSQLVVGQTKGEFEAKDPAMAKYLHKVKELTPSFQYFNILHIPRKNNTPVDSLSHLATSSVNRLGRVGIEYLDRPSIDEPEEVQQLSQEPSWIDPIRKYLVKGTLPENSAEAKKLRWKASQYVILDSHLYKRSFSLPRLRCLRPSEADFALWEVHEGTCENHLGGKSLAYKIL